MLFWTVTVLPTFIATVKKMFEGAYVLKFADLVSYNIYYIVNKFVPF